jgi:hypothetical protein
MTCSGSVDGGSAFRAFAYDQFQMFIGWLYGQITSQFDGFITFEAKSLIVSHFDTLLRSIRSNPLSEFCPHNPDVPFVVSFVWAARRDVGTIDSIDVTSDFVSKFRRPVIHIKQPIQSNDNISAKFHFFLQYVMVCLIQTIVSTFNITTKNTNCQVETSN